MSIKSNVVSKSRVEVFEVSYGASCQEMAVRARSTLYVIRASSVNTIFIYLYAKSQVARIKWQLKSILISIQREFHALHRRYTGHAAKRLEGLLLLALTCHGAGLLTLSWG